MPRVPLFPILLGATLLACGRSPTDQRLIAEFRSHRSDYEHLLAMFRTDRALGRVAYDFTRPANFFSGAAESPAPSLPTPARLAEYRDLFKRLALTEGVEGYDDKHLIYFIRYTQGMGAGLGGSSKGLAYSDSLPATQPASEGCGTPTADCWRFRPIGDGWFIFEEFHN